MLKCDIHFVYSGLEVLYIAETELVIFSYYWNYPQLPVALAYFDEVCLSHML